MLWGIVWVGSQAFSEGGRRRKEKKNLSCISSYIGITTIMRAPPSRLHLNLMYESGFSRETEPIVYLSLLLYVPTIPCMKCSFKMDKAIFRGKILFSYYLASGRWKFSRPMAQLCLNSQVPAPGIEEDLSVSTPSCAKEGRLSIF